MQFKESRNQFDMGAESNAAKSINDIHHLRKKMLHQQQVEKEKDENSDEEISSRYLNQDEMNKFMDGFNF